MLCCQHQKSTFAQINSDDTLPNNSQINQHKNIYNITGGTQAGHNLFHSFEKFSIPNNHEVYFDNAINIQNIINRVTGKSISEINGLIRANGKANFFLINPNGIVFGENSRLDIGGSFIGSTADSFKFTDGKEFSAIYPEEKPLLSINVPLGLQYGKNQSANIVNSGNLTVNNGSNITLIGNSLENTGKLATSSGQISLAAIDRQGFARLGKFGELLSIESQPVDGIDGYENNSGIVLNSGTINSFASTKKNNKIQILGNRVGLLENSLLDVSGNTGGGEIIIGNHNTLATYIDSKAFLKADAVNTGDGGSINVSATKSTRAYGTFSAKGGLDNGNGGLIDISGNHFLDVRDINIDTIATNGLNGDWLLKSNNILLVSQGHFRNAENDKFDIFQQSKGGTVLDAYTIEKQLSSGNNITIAADSTNSELGNIKADRVYIEPTNNSPITLTFQAANDISFSKGYIQPISNRLGVVLQADTNGSGKGNISLGNGIPYSFKINTRGEGFSASAISILLSGAEIMSSFSNVNDSKSIVLGAENSSGSQNKDIINQEKLKHEISGIDISAKNDILMQQSGIIKETDSAANSGDININADSFYIQVGGIENNTSGSGNAGDINFKVNLFSVKSGGTNSVTEGNGNSGSVNIETDILNLNTGRIQSLTKSFGHAG
ncbi:MAG: filamentous hemagglutinin N-terminal domain-containing protein, partial [Cyanobacteria bacterium J06573_2]